MAKSVYIHIPFCKQICSYCDFCKMFYIRKWVDKYLDKLYEEVKSMYEGEDLRTLYIGGGSPSALNPKELEKLSKVINLFNLSKNCEVTFEANINDLNDIYLTALFVKYTSSNKDIKENRKKTLNYNAMLQTGLTIPISYGIVKLLDKPTEKFISKLSAANANDPKLHKYIEGVKIAKPALIMGILYYIFAPVVSTILADKISNKKDSIKE